MLIIKEKLCEKYEVLVEKKEEGTELEAFEEETDVVEDARGMICIYIYFFLTREELFFKTSFLNIYIVTNVSATLNR